MKKRKEKSTERVSNAKHIVRDYPSQSGSGHEETWENELRIYKEYVEEEQGITFKEAIAEKCPQLIGKVIELLGLLR